MPVPAVHDTPPPACDPAEVSPAARSTSPPSCVALSPTVNVKSPLCPDTASPESTEIRPLVPSLAVRVAIDISPLTPDTPELNDAIVIAPLVVEVPWPLVTVMDPPDFFTDYNDTLLITYLCSLTQCANSTNELLDKFSVESERGLGGGGRGKLGVRSMGNLGMGGFM